MEEVIFQNRQLAHFRHQPPVRNVPALPHRQVQCERIHIDGDILSYMINDEDKVGVYISADALTQEKNYFEIEILDSGLRGTIAIGLGPSQYPLDCKPGWNVDSVGFHADDGRLYKGCGLGRPFGSKCLSGDRMGCGIKFDQNDASGMRLLVKVFFTRNGEEIGTVVMPWPHGGLHPIIGLHSEGEEVELHLDSHWNHDDVILMAVDNVDDEWSRLHQVRLNGCILEYTGRGKKIIDVGLAQARSPLDPTYHYFELEIVDPGENCYIAIGLARRDYPKHRHPGWNKGSIAYHAEFEKEQIVGAHMAGASITKVIALFGFSRATISIPVGGHIFSMKFLGHSDDGKLFVGSGVGEQFGPRCHKGDRMGCGILFPRDYRADVDSGGSAPSSPEEMDDLIDVQDYVDTDSDDGEIWDKQTSETNIQVFFTRNGRTIGSREMKIPQGGLYPTIGMLSSDEKVRVDLRPLTG